MPQRVQQLTLPERLPDLDISYTLRRSPRRRRTIEISIATSGEVRVAAPMRMPQREIDAFVRRKSRWIERAVASHQTISPEERPLVDGAQLLYLGEGLTLQVREDSDRGVQRVEDDITVRVSAGLSEAVREAEARRRLEAWYRAEAQRVFDDRVRHFAPLMRVTPQRVLVKTQKTRWGSCGRDGALRFNWTLIMAPLAVIDYLAVHELAHLRQAGHGVRFWNIVAKALPDYAWRRALLRREGAKYRL
jgi:predicted metal-dependent hydrolase